MMAAVDIPPPHESRAPRLAIRLSLAIGFLMLAIKVFAYWITGSAAILSDAAESVVHVVAVSFAAYSLWLSRKHDHGALEAGRKECDLVMTV